MTESSLLMSSEGEGSDEPSQEDLAAQHDLEWLRGQAEWPVRGPAGTAFAAARRPTLGVVDLFSGCGGLTVGAAEAARALGMDIDVRLAADMERPALEVYEDNFSPEATHADDIMLLVDRAFGQPLSASERALRRTLDGVDLVLGGPPCQGHSSLNNHTRRDDPKNSLYLAMARFAEVTRPDHLVIENVGDVVHSRVDVVGTTAKHLRTLGYKVEIGVLRAARIGVPQTRRRHVLIATRRDVAVSPDELTALHLMPERSVEWAIGDLAGAPGLPETPFDTASTPSATNAKRIDHLFDEDVHELPDEKRPDCHRLKPHTYKSVYGRMYADRPAPTITSGFNSMGQGRFVHPTQRRTITPHEAARLQGFPDSFSFGKAAGRKALARMIGNAVPSRLAYVPVLELLR